MPRKLYNALTSLAVKNAKPGRHADGGGAAPSAFNGEFSSQADGAYVW